MFNWVIMFLKKGSILDEKGASLDNKLCEIGQQISHTKKCKIGQIGVKSETSPEMGVFPTGNIQIPRKKLSSTLMIEQILGPLRILTKECIPT